MTDDDGEADGRASDDESDALVDAGRGGYSPRELVELVALNSPSPNGFLTFLLTLDRIGSTPDSSGAADGDDDPADEGEGADELEVEARKRELDECTCRPTRTTLGDRVPPAEEHSRSIR